jgi:hypothetical protein
MAGFNLPICSSDKPIGHASSARLSQGASEIISLPQVIGLVPDGSFFAHAGDDDLTDKLDLKIRQRFLEEFDDALSRFNVLFLEWDGYRRRKTLYLLPILGAVEINEPVNEHFHQGGRAVPIDGCAEDNHVALHNRRIDGSHIIVLAALLALPASVTSITLTDGQLA